MSKEDKPLAPKKPFNGWNKDQEKIAEDWCDIAMCYRWLHDSSDKIYTRLNNRMTIPVIILSTLSGTANFALQSFIGDNQEHQKYASAAVGGVSIITGIIATLNNFLRYAQLQESHRVASIAWGKFQRMISIELSLHPDDRMDSLDFLKICRTEVDRLIEQSPPIPDKSLSEFKAKFGNIEGIRKPDICDYLEHTYVYSDLEGQLKGAASKFQMNLKNRPQLIKETINTTQQMKMQQDILRREQQSQSQSQSRVSAENIIIDTSNISDKV